MKFYFDELDAKGIKMLNALVDANIDFAVYYDDDSEAMILELKGLKPQPRDGGWINPYPYTFPMISYEKTQTINPPGYTYTFNTTPERPQSKYTYNQDTGNFTLDDQ